jgi:hypothetical protein
MNEGVHSNVRSVCTPVILMSMREQSTCSFTSLKVAETQKPVYIRHYASFCILMVFSDDVMMWINGGVVYHFPTSFFH